MNCDFYLRCKCIFYASDAQIITYYEEKAGMKHCTKLMCACEQTIGVFYLSIGRQVGRQVGRCNVLVVLHSFPFRPVEPPSNNSGLVYTLVQTLFAVAFLRSFYFFGRCVRAMNTKSVARFAMVACGVYHLSMLLHQSFDLNEVTLFAHPVIPLHPTVWQDVKFRGSNRIS